MILKMLVISFFILLTVLISYGIYATGGLWSDSHDELEKLLDE